MICGACELELPDDAYSVEQRGLRQSARRCGECVAAGNQLVLMKKGLARSEEDDCPICNLLLPLDAGQWRFKVCCMKRVCDGCIFASLKRGMRDCPFCRAPTPAESQGLAMIQKRVDAGDPLAMYHLGDKYNSGECGLAKDMKKAVELWERAAELGVKEAHYNLGVIYDVGKVVGKDTAKAIRHYEAAAICGHVKARCNLGCEEGKGGNYDLALQHLLIAANMGHGGVLDTVKGIFISGSATKEYSYPVPRPRATTLLLCAGVRAQ